MWMSSGQSSMSRWVVHPPSLVTVVMLLIGSQAQDFSPHPAHPFAIGCRHYCIYDALHLYCWGDNSFGQCGHSVREARSIANVEQAMHMGGIHLPNHTAIRQVVLGCMHTCAEGTDGGITCWGGGAVGPRLFEDQLRLIADSAGFCNLQQTGMLAGDFVTCGAVVVQQHVNQQKGHDRNCWGWCDEAPLGELPCSIGNRYSAAQSTQSATATVSETPHYSSSHMNSVSASQSMSFAQSASSPADNSFSVSDFSSATPSHTLTITSSGTASLTTSSTASPATSSTLSESSTVSSAHTQSATATATAMESFAATESFSVSGSATATPSPTPTITPSGTTSSTTSGTASSTMSGTRSGSSTISSTVTATATATGSATVSRTATPTSSVSTTKSATASSSCTTTLTASSTPSSTGSLTATPTSTSQIERVNATVVAGGWRTCALYSNGSVKCWGAGGYGQLGYGSTENILSPTAQAFVPLGGVIKQLAAGERHNCALFTNRSVKCWGWGDSGRLGYGNTSTVLSPADAGFVPLGLNVIDLAAGPSCSCALFDNGSVKCWGGGSNGQLGHGTHDNVLSPAQGGFVPVGLAVKSLSVGSFHVCAVSVNGSVKCWGGGGNGQLGYNSTSTVYSPADVGFLPLGGSIAKVSAAYVHTCALYENGSVKCWGNNLFGQLGYGNSNDVMSPADVGFVPLGHPVTQIATGMWHTCALYNNGSVKCWGGGTAGRLGYGNEAVVTSPAQTGFVPVGGIVTGVATGEAHTCAVYVNGSVKCWGDSSSGQLGYGNTNNVLSPTAVGFVPLPSLQNIP